MYVYVCIAEFIVNIIVRLIDEYVNVGSYNLYVK